MNHLDCDNNVVPNLSTSNDQILELEKQLIDIWSHPTSEETARYNYAASQAYGEHRFQRQGLKLQDIGGHPELVHEVCHP